MRRQLHKNHDSKIVWKLDANSEKIYFQNDNLNYVFSILLESLLKPGMMQILGITVIFVVLVLHVTNDFHSEDCWCYITNGTLREEPNQINVILQQQLPAAKLSAVCTVYKQLLYVLLSCWLQLWLKNHCKNIRYYSIFQLSLLLLLNNYQYNCNNTISSANVMVKFLQFYHWSITAIWSPCGRGVGEGKIHKKDFSDFHWNFLLLLGKKFASGILRIGVYTENILFVWL